MINKTTQLTMVTSITKMHMIEQKLSDDVKWFINGQV